MTDSAEQDLCALSGRVSDLCCALAGNPRVPAPLIDRLIACGNTEICLVLSDRLDLTAGQIDRLGSRTDDLVVARLIQRGLLTAAQADVSDPQVVTALAEQGPIPPEWAWLAASSPDPRLRARLAAAPGTPIEVITSLANDSDVDVVAEVALSPNITAALAERLAGHPHLSVRRSVACNEHVPQDILRAWAKDVCLPRSSARLATAPKTDLPCTGTATETTAMPRTTWLTRWR